jgi:hypothetical protein
MLAQPREAWGERGNGEKTSNIGLSECQVIRCFHYTE